MNELKQSTVVELTLGIAPRSLDVRHKVVRKYLYPSDSVRGPTTLISKSETCGFLTSIGFNGGWMGHTILTSWHGMHVWPTLPHTCPVLASSNAS